MNKNNKRILDELKDITKMTLNIQKLNWYNQELIMNNCYYRHIIKQAIEYIDKRKKDINECLDIVVPKDVTRLILIELLDILKGSVDDE